MHIGTACVGAALCTSPKTRQNTTQRTQTQPPQHRGYVIRCFLLTDSVAYASAPFLGRFRTADCRPSCFGTGAFRRLQTFHRISTAAASCSHASAGASMRNGRNVARKCLPVRRNREQDRSVDIGLARALTAINTTSARRSSQWHEMVARAAGPRPFWVLCVWGSL